jgi:hypothetical protein
MAPRPRQLAFHIPTWGGHRRRAGRKPSLPGPRRVAHRPRPSLAARFPVHVSLRITGGLPSLRGRALWGAVRRGFVFGRVFGEGEDSPEVFRIVHFSVQGQHIHLLVEADDRRALSRGMQAFEIRVARAVNKALGRSGRVFADRYHQRIVTNPTQCRHALAYVLANQRRHAAQECATYPRNQVDPCSSAAWFDGWTVSSPWPWANAPPTDTDGVPPVVRPRTWLLAGGWRRGGGPISPSSVPGLPKGAPPLPEWGADPP